MKKFFNIYVILLILFIACLFRFNNLYWDANFHLHPDERFLTMVGNAMKLPTSVNQYFNQKTSLLNPANIGYNFFVYGRFPLILTKYLAVNLNLDNYNDFTILGRQLSAFFDLLVVIFVFKTILLLEKHYKFSSSIKYWASFFYAIAVLPIQLSHFFAVDTFLNFFMFGSFYCALRVDHDRPLRNTILSALFFGLALASKITALFILPLNLFFIIKTVLGQRQSLTKVLYYSIIYFGISYFILRLADPYLFQSANFFNPRIDPNFIANLKSLSSYLNKDIWYPPAIQWINKKPLPFSLVNLAVFGIGIPYFVLMITGIGGAILNIKDQISKISSKFKVKNIKPELLVILIWTLAFFFYQGTRFNPGMRYFLIIYPFLAIFAALGMNKLFKTKNYMFYVICFILLIIWPIMFSSIYFNKHTRVEASKWIYKNLPSNSVILGESWDDSLPLSVINNYDKQFTVEQLPVFDPDTPIKWQKMNEMLAKANYYVLSSNRGWGSIMTVPEKYPQMSQFYQQLLNDKLSYKKIKEFKPYYYKFFQLPNSWVDESFTVYDHPEILIYKNVKK
jgi:hypothetical protein